MSAIQSHLSNSKYGYDLVAGVTQASINATMKVFLDKFEGKEFIQCYVYEKDPETGKGHFVVKDFEALKTELGKNPFDIPDGSSGEDVKKLYEMKFGFAFRAEMGLPTSFPIQELPDIIKLDKGSTTVNYNLVCKEFQILNLEDNFGDLNWTNLSQNTQPEPWVFNFLVDLDLLSSDSAFASLPADVQQAVKNLCPDSMFSVQQLYLDLNTPALASAPTIHGVDPTSNTYIYLTKIFINAYFKKLQQDNVSSGNPEGNVMLGYTIKPSNPGKAPSVIPTDLNFMVSPYLDENGNVTTNYPLYTLNYLVMTKGDPMPVPVPFDWNWVQESEIGDFNGVMAIRRNIFVNYLNELLSPTLDSVCLKPSASIECTSNPFKPLRYTIGISRDTTEKRFSVVQDGTSEVLRYSFTSEASKKKDFCWGNWTNISLKYTIDSKIYFSGNLIKTRSVATMRMHFNLDGAVYEGDYVKYRVETDYELGVDQYGNLTVVMAPGSPKFTDESQKIDKNIWGEIISLGTLDGFLKDVRSYLDVMRSFLTGHQSQILQMMNGSRVWVFPGGQTFVFKDVMFSDYQDLVANVTYAEPTADRLNNQATAETLEFERAAAKLSYHRA